MLFEVTFLCESFAALVALKRPLPSVRPHVLLQMTINIASMVALVTLVWLFSCMLPHHVYFQSTSPDAGILAQCASVRLFSRVGPFVLHQIAWMSCSKAALIALVWLLSSMFHNVLSQMGCIICWIIALCATIWFFPSVKEEVSFQTSSSPKWLVALWTVIPLASTVSLPVLVKATSICKFLGTQVTRLLICHLLISTSFAGSLCLTVEIYVNTIQSIWSLSLSPRIFLKQGFIDQD